MHKAVYFNLGSFPVFYTERIQGQRFDAEIDAVLGYFLDGLSTTPVSFRPGQTFFPCPSAVAVHNNRNVPRHLFERHTETFACFFAFPFEGLVQFITFQNDLSALHCKMET
jgi:hypothetical protein